MRQGDIPGVQLRRRRSVPEVGADQLWRWLVDSELRRQWLGELENGLVELSASVDQRGAGCWRGEVRRADWRAKTSVVIRVVAEEEGSSISVEHGGFHELSLSSCLTVWEESRRRWDQALDRLLELSSNREPDAFTSRPTSG